MHKKIFTLGVWLVFCLTALFTFEARGEGSVEEYMAQGSALLRNGAYTEAITSFRKVLSMEPRNFEAQFNLAFAFLQSERYDKAIAEYNKAISLEPRNANCWANIGFAYQKAGKMNKAADAIGHAVELNPNNVEARMNLAAMYEDANARDKAIAQYEAVIRIDGKRGEAYSGVARCLTDKGNLEGAKKYLNEAIMADPTNADAHWQMGNILWKKEKKPGEAIKEYQKAIKLAEDSQIFYENLALLQEELGEKEDALATWKKFQIYLNDALKKEEVQRHIDKIEKGEPTSSSDVKAAAKENRQRVAQDDSVRMQELRSELRKDKKGEAKRMDAQQPVDIGSDIANINKDTNQAIDFRKEAKKKAEAKKEGQ
jgi:tetratricopeptide (TPR) repeat protein